MDRIEILTVFAVLAGPILAVQAQKFIEIWKERRTKKLGVFKTLMATRGSPISSAHVEALNMIDLEFYGKNKKEQAVVEAWKIYLSHLSDGPKDIESETYQSRFDAWFRKNNDLLTDLLQSMAACLGYHFDKVHLQKGVYVPQGHTDLELEKSLVRRGTLDVLSGRRSIPIIVSNDTKKTD